MKRKLIFIFCILSLIFTAVSVISFPTPQIPLSERHCAFCDQSILATHTFYEDDLVMALCTHRPIFPGHCLVIPRRHVERFEELSDQELLQIGKIIRKVNTAAMKVYGTSSYLLLQKNGIEAGQSVPHVHVHYIPRPNGDTSTLKFFFNMLLADIGKPISADEMRTSTKKMRDALHVSE